MTKSIEPNITELGNGWLRSYKVDYKLEQEELNQEIDNALSTALSKTGGLGGNRPDTKLIKVSKSMEYFPVLIEYKGTKQSLKKLDENANVANVILSGKNSGLPNYTNINKFAVNGAVHYANAVLQYTSFTDVIAIGMTGYKDAFGKIVPLIGVYYVSKENYGTGIKVGDYTDFSFLTDENFDDFIQKIKELKLSDEEIQTIRERRESEIRDALGRLNDMFFERSENISPQNRIHLVSACIIATLGIPHKVSPLELTDLKSLNEDNNSDGDIIMRKVSVFLQERKIPRKKQELITNTLKTTILEESLNIMKNGTTPLREIFSEIMNYLGNFYKIGLDTDFTGNLFNVMYGWLNFNDDDKNDVVLTPTFVSNLLAKLARVNKDSYVWDLAMGSGGLLVSAMNIMLDDAKNSITSPEQLAQKQIQIKSKQLLGVELRPSIHILAVLNMILMGDGSSNIIQSDSLLNFVGNYGFSNEDELFPANAFILNPPYSAEGNGMVFVKKAFSLMKSGYASIIIQSSAGSGKATEINQQILENNTLIASIKMPRDLFIGKSNVPTHIYVFRVGEKHNEEDTVKFIDFTNDGYKRTNRRTSKPSTNLKDINNAKERYQEIVDLVRFGVRKLNHFTESEYYEGTINPSSGNDWNQAIPQDSSLCFDDYYYNLNKYFIWESREYFINNIFTSNLSDDKTEFNHIFKNQKMKEFKMRDLFTVVGNSSINTPKDIKQIGKYPYFTRTVENNGVRGYTDIFDESKIIAGNVIAVGLMGNKFFYMSDDFFAGQFTKRLVPKFELNPILALYFTTYLNKNNWVFDPSSTSSFDERFYDLKIELPINNSNTPNYSTIEDALKNIKRRQKKILQSYLNQVIEEIGD